MKNCAPLGHSSSSSSPIVSKRQDLFLPNVKLPVTGVRDICEFVDDKYLKIEGRRKFENFKPKMPALLRLDSVGEVSSSCSFVDGNKSRFRSSSMVNSKEHSSTSSGSTCSYSSGSHFPIAAQQLKMFTPTHQSTPIKCPQGSSEPLFHKASFSNRSLFLNHSVPAPSCKANWGTPMEAQMLHTSMSSPALWNRNCSLKNSLVKQYSMPDTSAMDVLTLEWCRESGSSPTGLLFSKSVLQQMNEMPCQGKEESNMQQSESKQSERQEMLSCKLEENPDPAEQSVEEEEVKKVNPTEMKSVHEHVDSNSKMQLEKVANSSQKDSLPDGLHSAGMNGNMPASNSSACSNDGGPTIDRTFVLFQRRKSTKKGRPSAKKQKKRRREKLKQSEAASDSEASSFIISFSVNEESESDESEHGKEKLGVRVSYTSSPDCSGGAEEKVFDGDDSQVSNSEGPKTHPSLACIFYSEAEVESDSQTTEDSDDSWWSEEEDEDKGKDIDVNFCFGGALSLDDMFKKKEVPSSGERSKDTNSLYSPIGSPSKFTVHINSPGSSSQDDSFQFSYTDSESIDLSSPVLQSLQDSFSDFNQGLNLDSILGVGVVSVKKVSSKPKSCQLATERSEENPNTKLGDINTRWDGHYPTAGFRSCSGTEPVIQNSAVKVRFADDSSLETVHEVGTEDRRGSWHIDGSRFRERIERVGQTLSPILDAKHREKVCRRNLDLEAAMKE